MHARRSAWPRREMKLTEPKCARRSAWPTQKAICPDAHGLATLCSGLRVDDDLHGQHVECLLPMPKHGEWLSAITSAAMIDHLNDEAPFWWRHRLTCWYMRRHTTFTKKLILIEKRVPVPKDESPQIDVLNNSLDLSSWIWYGIGMNVILLEKIEFSNWTCFPTRTEIHSKQMIKEVKLKWASSEIGN